MREKLIKLSVIAALATGCAGEAKETPPVPTPREGTPSPEVIADTETPIPTEEALTATAIIFGTTKTATGRALFPTNTPTVTPRIRATRTKQFTPFKTNK